MKKLLFVITFLLLSCSNTNLEIVEPKEEEPQLDYQLIDHIEYETIFSQPEEQYRVYFYSKTCGHCEILKKDILSYALSNIEIVYFIDFTDLHYYGNKKDLTGICSIDDFYIFGTPFFVGINNGAIKDYYYGVNQIREYIASKKSES